MKSAIIKIKNLSLRTIIGFNEVERTNKQDVLINIHIEVNADGLSTKDQELPPFNYRTLTKKIIQHVEASQFNLLENLTESILTQVMKEKEVIQATVEVDKPHALRFSESVSVQMSCKKSS